MNQMNKHESGYTLIGVLAIFTIASVLALSLVMMSANTLKASKTEADNQSVFYIAEAGLNNAVNEFKKEANKIHEETSDENEFFQELNKELNSIVKLINGISPNEALRFTQINGKDPEATINIERIEESPGEYKVSSLGEIEPQTRKVEQDITIDWKAGNSNNGQPSTWGDFEDFGVYTFGEMSLNDGEYAKDIGTANTDKGSLNLINKVKINESNDVFVPNGDKDIVNNNSGNSNLEPKSKEPLQPPPMPKFIDTDDGNWDIYENCPPAFSMNNEVKNIILKNRTTFAGCGITVMGHGGENAELNIFIDNSVEVPTHTQILTPPGIPINLYVNGEVIVPKGSSGSIIMAAIYAQDDIKIESSAGAQFYGSLFSKGSILFEKDSSKGLIYGETIYAKKDVTFEGNGNVLHGTSVIGSNVKLDKTVIETKLDPNRIKSGSLSLNELKQLPPDDENNGPEYPPPPNEDSNGGIIITPGSLHEVDNNDKN